MSVRTLVWRLLIRLLVTVIASFVRVFEFLLPSPKKLPDSGIKILLTGAFYSDNWIITHLRPLAAASSVAEVRMVSSSAVPEMEGVVPIYPSSRMTRIFGSTGARFITLARESFTWRPDIIGGFHLLLNGLIAQLLARLRSRHCIYFCGGGVREVEGGGHRTENRLFNKLRYSSAYVEKRLLGMAVKFDFLITMGLSVKQYFVSNGATRTVEAVPGGFAAETYRPASTAPIYDLVTVGRLSSVKRVSLLLNAVALLNSRGCECSAAIVGDGPDTEELKDLAADLEISDRVTFAGWQSEVHDWLRQSRIFTLTSESEGLSQAMVQAMLCGLPAVVSNVGDLGDLVVDGKNGLLVDDQSASGFAAAYESILSDVERARSMSSEARSSATNLDFDRVSARWDAILRSESSN